MQPVNQRFQFDATGELLFMLLAAVYIVLFAFIELNVIPFAVEGFIAVSALGITIMMNLYWVLAKVRVFQEDAKKEVLVLAKRLADADSRRHAMSDKLAVMEERLDDGHQTIASLFGRLATTSKELIDQTAMTAVLSKSVEDITAELDAANTKFQASNEEVAARDKMIAHQRLEIVEGRQLVAVLSHANGVLGCMLAKTQTQLKDAQFHLEVQQLSGKAVKAKASRLQGEVKNLQCLMLSLQLPAPTSARGDDAASIAKNDAAAATLDGASSGTLSTAPSPSDSGGSSVSRSGSSGNMSNSGDSGIAQPVVPRPLQAEASPAAVHTGAQDRPKRARKPKQGHQQSRSSSKKVHRMVAGMYRGVAGMEKMPERKVDGAADE